ncbi:hypothetical protein AKJ16_DCAP11111 [Drosera capensis]
MTPSSLSISYPAHPFTNPNPNIPKSRVRVSVAKTRDCVIEDEIRVDNCTGYGRFSGNLKLSGSLSSTEMTTTTKMKKSKEDEERENYYVNMGYAIRCLREEFPELFQKEPSFDIYREDIVFKDPMNTFVGIENYKTMCWALRFHGKMFFKALWIDIISVWQPMESVILVRWTVHGIPRVPWESRGRFDGISEFKLDKTGKIYEHKVDNIAPSPPRKFHVMSVEELIQSLGCPSTPKPTCFEISSSSAVNTIPLMVALAWLRQYLSLPHNRSPPNGLETSQKS